MSLTPGVTFGPYQVLAKLGEGGMGEVYRARDTKLNRDVAVKILPDVFAHDTERVARFTREARTLASLNHPNIAQIYGILEEPASPGDPARHVHALVMELVEGEDLSQRIARGAIPLDEALPIASQIADALEAAHEQGIVHRDLKPANIKVREDGTVKVLDFGLARAADRSGASSPDQSNSPTMVSPAMTAMGMIMGTAAYMSPEQAKGKAVDKRADIWAFGVVLHEMLTGVRLFTGDSVTETLAAVLTHEADLKGLPRATPAPVASLLRRCLERDPKRRLRDIGEARLSLSGQIDASPVASPGVQPGRWNVRRLLLAVALAGLGFAAGFGAASMVGRSVPEAAAGAAFTVTPLTASGNVISATVSPDGRHIAYVESEQGRQSLWIQQVAGGQSLRLIPEQNVAYWSHAFTPDGNDIVYGLKSDDDPEGGLYAISMLGGSPKRLVGNIDSSPTYSPDGRRMAYLRLRHPSLDQTSLMVAGADGSNPTALMSVRLPEYVAGIFFGGPAWSPDGKTIVTSLGRRGSAGSDVRATLIQVSVETGAVSTLADPGWLVAAQAAWMPDGKSLLVIARAPDQLAAQIWSVSYPDGEARRVTSDLNDHRIISLTRDGRTLVSVSGIVSASVLTLPRDGGRPVRVSRSTQDGLQGVAFAADGSIVYSSEVGGASSLWRAGADGANRSPLIEGTSLETLAFPAVADDGTIYHVASSRRGVEIRAVPGDGSSPRILARDVRADVISASRDGETVVFSALVEGVPHLFRVGRDGGGRRQISTAPSFVPSIDPSGRRVAFYYRAADGRFRIGVSSIDGGPLLADLPAEAPGVNSRLVLTDDGVYLNTMPGDRANLWLRPLDGRPAVRVTSFEDQLLFDFAVSRDGTMFSFVRGPRLRDAQLITGFGADAAASDERAR